MPGVCFPDQIALLTELLNRQDAIVAEVENRLLNVQGKNTARNRSRDYFDRILNSCFYDTPGLSRALSELKGQLHASHVADGFEPVVLDGAALTLDPLELILRAYDIWDARDGQDGRGGSSFIAVGQDLAPRKRRGPRRERAIGVRRYAVGLCGHDTVGHRLQESSRRLLRWPDVIGQGFDALIRDVPEPVIDVLRVTCPRLVVVVNRP